MRPWNPNKNGIGVTFFKIATTKVSTETSNFPVRVFNFFFFDKFTL